MGKKLPKLAWLRRHVIRDLSVLKKSDMLLFWAYRAPAALHLPDWQGA